MTQSKQRYEITEAQRKIIDDLSLSVDVVAFMCNLPANYIATLRYAIQNTDKRKESIRKYNAKLKKENRDKFGKAHACYRYWTAEEIEYIMTSTDTDKEQAEKLNRTRYSIQKKRERVMQDNATTYKK